MAEFGLSTSGILETALFIVKLCYIRNKFLQEGVTMDVSNVSTASSVLFDQPVSKDVGTEMLKKALDTQAQTAATLINSLSQQEKSTATNLPSHLGQTINTTA